MKLSIITVNYNNQAGLQRTIDSVVCQTWQDFEWLVIDGGSTDGSQELIENNQQHFAYWCSEADRGVFHAMNKGVQQAHGDYLLFLNSGDALADPTVLQQVADTHVEADIIAGQAVRMDNGQPLRHYDPNVLVQLYTDTLNHQATFIRRSLLDAWPYDETLRIVSDWKFWLDAVLKGQAQVAYIDVVVVLQDMTGISASLDPMHAERSQVIAQYFPVGIQEALDHYLRLRQSPYTAMGDHLRQRSRFLYALGRYFLKIISRLA